MKHDYHLDVPRRMQIELSRIVQSIADADGGEIAPATIWSVFANEYLPTPDAPWGRIQLAGYRSAPPEARTGSRRPRGGRRADTLVVRGNGPIDAFVNALAAARTSTRASWTTSSTRCPRAGTPRPPPTWSAPSTARCCGAWAWSRASSPPRSRRSSARSTGRSAEPGQSLLPGPGTTVEPARHLVAQAAPEPIGGGPVCVQPLLIHRPFGSGPDVRVLRPGPSPGGRDRSNRAQSPRRPAGESRRSPPPCASRPQWRETEGQVRVLSCHLGFQDPLQDAGQGHLLLPAVRRRPPVPAPRGTQVVPRVLLPLFPVGGVVNEHVQCEVCQGQFTMHALARPTSNQLSSLLLDGVRGVLVHVLRAGSSSPRPARATAVGEVQSRRPADGQRQALEADFGVVPGDLNPRCRTWPRSSPTRARRTCCARPRRPRWPTAR